MSQEPANYDARMESEILELGLVSPRVRKEEIDALMERVVYHVAVIPGTTTTAITSYIPMGEVMFTLATTTLACVDKRNFNEALGRKYGIEKCANLSRDKLWELEGYTLAKRYEERVANEEHY